MLFNANLLKELDELTSPDRYKAKNLLESFMFLIKDFFRVKKFLRKLRKNITTSKFYKKRRKELINKAQAEIILSRRLGMLRTMQNLFRYWHIAHLPFALVMFVIMIVHVLVTIAFGYKWIF
jgi:hypothetical protein